MKAEIGSVQNFHSSPPQAIHSPELLPNKGSTETARAIQPREKDTTINPPSYQGEESEAFGGL